MSLIRSVFFNTHTHAARDKNSTIMFHSTGSMTLLYITRYIAILFSRISNILADIVNDHNYYSVSLMPADISLQNCQFSSSLRHTTFEIIKSKESDRWHSQPIGFVMTSKGKRDCESLLSLPIGAFLEREIYVTSDHIFCRLSWTEGN